ncbi:hypothetical protein CBR_g45277 [Chara braunii]|uniref:Right handed beta helix domain-containing protein n=1 Tax=Chara braunii TaxID=69332 RepID=A0A388LY15_CHABU|nr:hypothetical protein CBR_g45277 [Chara braunii]|eukprot:GBG87218.1 hypothetical protein CBR_g45277 [Chara braunii]
MEKWREWLLVAMVVGGMVLALARPSDGGSGAAAPASPSRPVARRSPSSSAAENALAKAITASNGAGKGKVVVLTGDVLLTKALPLIPFEGNLVLRGSCGRRKCVVDGAGKFAIFMTYTPGCWITLENLEFRNARDGAVSGKCSVIIKDCVFRGNRGAPVVALGIGDPTFNVSSTVFVDNNSNSTCGALCSSSRGGGRLSNCSFIRNSAMGDGGAVYLWGVGSKPLLIEDCTFDGNTAGASGGALYIEPNGIETYADVYVFDTQFKGNRAKTIGGAVTLLSDIKGHFCGGGMSGNAAGSGKGNDLALIQAGSLPVFVNFCPRPPKLSVHGVPSMNEVAVVDNCRLCGVSETQCSFPFK